MKATGTIAIDMPSGHDLRRLWELEVRDGLLLIPSDERLPMGTIVAIQFSYESAPEAIEMKGRLAQVTRIEERRVLVVEIPRGGRVQAAMQAYLRGAWPEARVLAGSVDAAAALGESATPSSTAELVARVGDLVTDTLVESGSEDDKPQTGSYRRTRPGVNAESGTPPKPAESRSIRVSSLEQLDEVFGLPKGSPAESGPVLDLLEKHAVVTSSGSWDAATIRTDPKSAARSGPAPLRRPESRPRPRRTGPNETKPKSRRTRPQTRRTARPRVHDDSDS